MKFSFKLFFILFAVVCIFCGFKCRGTFDWLKKDSQFKIVGEDIVPAGAIAVYKLDGSESADWTIVPQTDVYIDSNSGAFVFTASSGEFHIIACSVRNGKPVIAEKKVIIGDKPAPDHDEVKPEPDSLEGWLKVQREKMSEDNRQKISSVFLSVCQLADTKEVLTVAGIRAAIRKGVLANGVTECDSFLDDFGARITDTNPKSADDVAKLLRLFVD